MGHRAMFGFYHFFDTENVLFFSDRKNTPELHVNVLRAGTFPVLAFLKTIWPVLLHASFVIAVISMKNHQIPEIKPIFFSPISDHIF